MVGLMRLRRLQRKMVFLDKSEVFRKNNFGFVHSKSTLPYLVLLWSL